MLDFDAKIEAARGDLLALSSALVAAESVNPPGRTADVAQIISSWLAERGVPCEIVASDAEAPNVISQIDGARTADSGGAHVVFNAHMDTMPVGDEQRWTVPPFETTHRDGRVYGHGMGNMKGALAAMCLVTALAHRNVGGFAGKLSLTAVSDEVMFGDRGTVFLLQQRPDLRGDFLISGEGPGFMDLAVAEKGLLWLDVRARCDGGHSSNALPGATAPIMLAHFLADADRLNIRFAEPPPELPGVSGGDGNLGFRLSINVGSLRAGGVRSQIATDALAALDIRLPPGISADEAEDAVRTCVPAGAAIDIVRVKGWDANWTSADHPLVQIVARAAEAVRGTSPRQVVRLPGSDARRWRDLGVPAICYGPQPTLSAGIDDYAYEQDLVDCAKVYARAALALLTDGA